MFNTIQELENEIALFRKNIKDSNELMRILLSLAEITKAQTETFDSKAKTLLDEISKMPPELSGIIEAKVAQFRVELQKDQQNFHQVLTDLLEGFGGKLSQAEKLLVEVPATIEQQTKCLSENHLAEVSKLNAEYTKKLEETNESFKSASKEHEEVIGALLQNFEQKISESEKAVAEIPTTLERQTQNSTRIHLEEIQRINLEYSNELSRINEKFIEKIQAFAEQINAVPARIINDMEIQNSKLITGVNAVLDEHTSQIIQLDNHMSQLTTQLETKYSAFVEKLESTNMDQLYKYCQDMNKSISIKLGLALGGVGLAVIISIISLFI